MADEENLYGSYAYRSARSKSSRLTTLDNMAQQGREPSFNAKGNIRGFRTTPGAPLSSRDSMTSLGVPTNPKGGLSDSSAWGNFFKGNSPTGVRMGYDAASPSIAQAAFPMGTSTDTASASPSYDPSAPSLLTNPVGFGSLDQTGYLDNVISNAQNFLRRAGGNSNG